MERYSSWYNYIKPDKGLSTLSAGCAGRRIKGRPVSTGTAFKDLNYCLLLHCSYSYITVVAAEVDGATLARAQLATVLLAVVVFHHVIELEGHT